MTNHPGYPPQQAYPNYPPPPHQAGYPGYPPGYEGGYQAAPQWPQQYEFTETENKTIERCAAWSKALAVFNFFSAALQLINFNIVGIAINIGIGLAFWKASKSLESVVETQGNDVQHLMDALKSLSSALLIRLILIAVACGILLLVGLIVGVVFLAV
jgi:hypothetical protein